MIKLTAAERFISNTRPYDCSFYFADLKVP